MQISKQTLTKEQKRAIGILSIGTFLEYFDLMLYVHMAVLLNGLFFSTGDNFSSKLLSAFSFSVTFIFRPAGAILIGWLGDNIGRKSTVIITSLAMAVSCVMMANLPTYDQIGVLASWAVTICRVVQGMSSMGEVIGANLYLTESISEPLVYPAVVLMVLSSMVGGTVALGVAKLSLGENLNWRWGFWIGAVVAFVGIYSRTCLRETIDFVDAKRQINTYSKDFNIPKKQFLNKPWYKEKINKKLLVAYYLLEQSNPVAFYFTYMYCSYNILQKLHYSTGDIIQHNLIVSLIKLMICCGILFCSIYVKPLKFLKVRFIIFLPIIALTPFWLDSITNQFELLIFQSVFCIFEFGTITADPIFYKSFPVLKRFTTTTLTFSISRAIIYVISSFGLIFLTDTLGNYGLWILLVPVAIGYGWGLWQFIKVEAERDKEAQQKILELAKT
jgi:MHS family proline/betaine transporter-like MFS transporter